MMEPEFEMKYVRVIYLFKLLSV